MTNASQPYADNAGQGLQTEAAQLGGVVQDAGPLLPPTPIKKEIDRVGMNVEDIGIGTGQAITDSPRNAADFIEAARA